MKTLDDFTESFLLNVEAEVGRARAKFPLANLAFVALVEEVGELAKALLRVRGATPDNIEQRIREMKKEAVQVAAMACRVATEDDASFKVEISNPGAL